MIEVEIQTERVDDIPLLVKQQQRMGIAEIIDGIIKPHWRRQGLSVGQTIEVWLSYILSESDHRMSYVEPWVGRHKEILKRLVNSELRVEDFNDDRLGDVLRYLSEEASWQAIEQELGRRTIRVYELKPERVRLDSTTVSLHHDPEGTELIRYGYSKDHRPDLAQLKVMLATLDPLGLPVVTQLVAGSEADDGLYSPAVDEVRQGVGQKGLLYLGDSKMEALKSRGHIAAGGDYYLTPLSLKGGQAELLTELVQAALAGEQDLIDVYREPSEDQQPQVLAQGYEITRPQEAMIAGKWVEWTERILVIYSPTLAQAAYRGLQSRLQRAEKKLLALTPKVGRGKRQYDDLAPLQSEVETILQQHRVTDLLQVIYEPQITQRQVRQYKDRPARTEQKVRYQLHLNHNQAAIEAHYQMMGWRLYALNAPTDQFSLAQACLAYRDAALIERDFSRLKGRPLGLRPAYLHREDHLIGLVRLLSLALRVLTLTEFVARRCLQTEDEPLIGLLPSHPNQPLQRPTTERLLAAFNHITLSFVQLPGQTIVHITPLSLLQIRILSVLDFSPAIYTDLAANSLPNPP